MSPAVNLAGYVLTVKLTPLVTTEPALVVARTVLLHVAPPAGMPHQERMLDAGRYLCSRGIGPVGAWNAGIIGGSAGGRIVNLDGLVNNEVYPCLVAGRLPDPVSPAPEWRRTS